MLSKDKAKKAKQHDASSHKPAHAKIRAEDFPFMDHLKQDDTHDYRSGLFDAGNGYYMRVFATNQMNWGVEITLLRFQVLGWNFKGELEAENMGLLYDEGQANNSSIIPNSTRAMSIECLYNKMQCLMTRKHSGRINEEAARVLHAVPMRDIGVKLSQNCQVVLVHRDGYDSVVNANASFFKPQLG